MAPFGRRFKKSRPAPSVISTEAKRSGEISPSDGTGGITVGDLSTQSIMGAFSICPIPTCSPARDDGDGEQHPVISERDEPHSRHFDRSVAEWRNLPLSWYRRHYGRRSLDSEHHGSGSCLPPIAARTSARDDGGGFAALESAQTIEPGRRRRHPAFGNTASRQRTADSRQPIADSRQRIADSR